MTAYKFHVEVVTPMFIGGASPNGEAEIRSPSIKGMLRWWFRILGGSRRSEERIFGTVGSKAEASGFKIFVGNTLKGKWEFIRDEYRNFDRKGRCPSEDIVINGIVYAGFPLSLGKNARKAIPASKEFTINIIPGPKLKDDELKLLTSLMWVIGHLGGLGTRWRRGFGSIKLLESNAGIDPISASNPEEWIATFKNIWDNEIKRAISPFKESASASVWQVDKLYVWQDTFYSWEEALDEIASQMQSFRQCYNPDHDEVYNFVFRRHRLKTAPQRTVFGMPLAFRFRRRTSNSPRKGSAPTVRFLPEHHERMASPIIFHITKLNQAQYLPMLICLSGSFLEPNENIKIHRRNIKLDKPYQKVDTSSSLIGQFIETIKSITTEVKL